MIITIKHPNREEPIEVQEDVLRELLRYGRFMALEHCAYWHKQGMQKAEIATVHISDEGNRLIKWIDAASLPPGAGQ